MARTGILGCIFDLLFFCGPRNGEEVENERHEGGERERTKSQGPRGLGRRVTGRRWARGEMGEGRQVMLGPRHTRGERKIERKGERKKERV